MVNNYDKIANYYDALSRFVYGKSQVNAQINQLKYIPENSSILIVGGGTGWILDEISKIYPAALHITYVEISAKMINLSKYRNVNSNFVVFVNMDVEEFISEELFDIILTPFLFDNFNTLKAESIFKKLNKMLKEKGLWFLVDFSLNDKKGKWWKWVLLRLMYFFFKIIGIVEANDLVDMNAYFLAAKHQIVEERFYYGNFIKASIFKKQTSCH